MRPVGDNAVMRRFNVLVVQPTTMQLCAVSRRGKSMYFALRRLGYDVRLAGNEFLRDATNVIFGAHHLAGEIAVDLPSTRSSTTPTAARDGAGRALTHLSRASRPGNRTRATSRCGAAGAGQPRPLRPAGIPAESSTVAAETPTDIDVLFFGKVNRAHGYPRRVMRAGISLPSPTASIWRCDAWSRAPRSCSMCTRPRTPRSKWRELLTRWPIGARWSPSSGAERALTRTARRRSRWNECGTGGIVSDIARRR